MYVPNVAIIQFEMFISDWAFMLPGEDHLEPQYPDHLADYAYDWLAFGHAARHCAGDFSVFLSTFALITARWVEDPTWPLSMQLELPREQTHWAASPTKVLEQGCNCCDRTFDPQFFALTASDPGFMLRFADGDDPFALDLPSYLVRPK